MDNRALPGEAPYKGLSPYTEADSEWFFGRDSQVRVVSTNLMSARITVLYAGSGVGKTSILRAGVLPALHKEARRSVGRDRRAEFAVALHSRWQDDPITSLREAVASAVADAGGRPPALERFVHLDDALAGCADAVEAGLLVIFDQFEEWFLYHGQTIGEGSPGDELVRAMTREDIPVRYLVSLREDALARLDWFKGRVPGMFENLLRLRHLDRPAGRAAIEGPIERYNAEHADVVEVEPGAVEHVLDEVRAGAVLVGQQGQGAIAANGGTADGERIEAPFLQLVMTRLWNEERALESRRLRLETLERLGGADRIVGTYLDESLGALDPEDQTVAADAFNHLVTPSGTKIAHSVADLAQYTGASGDRLERVLGDLTRMRILRPVAPPPGEDRSSRFEIFHDVLAPAVLDWRARFLHRRASDQLAERFGRTLRRTAVGGVIGLLALMAVIAFVYQQSKDAQRARDLAKSGELAGQALAVLNFDSASATQRALRAVDLAATPTSEDALRVAAPTYLRLAATFPTAVPVKWVGFAGPGRILTYQVPLGVPGEGPPGRATLWSIENSAAVRTFPDLMAAALSTSGRFLVGVSTAGDARVWDLRMPTRVTPLGENVQSVAISPDGERILTWDAAPGQTEIWDREGNRAPVPFLTDTKDAAFTPDHHQLVTLSPTRGAEVWSFDAGLSPISDQSIRTPASATGVSIDPSGMLVAIRRPTDVILQRVGGGRSILRGSGAAINTAKFDASGDRIVTTSEDGIARVYDTRTRDLSTTLATTSGSLKDAVFGDKGALVATAGTDGRARIWNATLGTLSPLVLGGSTPLASVAFSQGSTMLATGGTGITRVWRVGTPEKARVGGVILDATINPAKPAMIGVASPVRRAYLWTRGTATLQRLGSRSSNGIAFSDDGKYVLTITRVPGQAPRTLVWSTSAPSAGPLGARRFVAPGIALFHHPSFSRDDHSVVLSTSQGARVWAWQSTKAGRLSPRFGGSLRFPNVYAAQYSPDGSVIVTGETGVLHLWRARDVDPTTGVSSPRPIQGPEMRLGSSGVTAVAFDRHGSHVAAGDGEGDVRVWDVRSHRPTSGRLNIPAIVQDVSFSSDGERLLIAGTDGTVRVWNWRSGQVLATLPLHAGAARAAEYVPDHPAEILSAGDDGLVEITTCPTCVPLPGVVRLAQEHLARLRRHE
jgi:WD40 repeat protein